MIGLILLPFRGLVWLVLGLIFSLPWLIVLLPVTTNYWVPKVLSYGIEHKIQVPCRIEATSLNLATGEFVLKNVSIFNGFEFHSTDGIKFKTIRGTIDITSLLSPRLHIKELSLNCCQISFVKQGNAHNFLPLGKLFSRDSGKDFIIDKLNFNIDGFVAIKSYSTTSVRSSEFFTKRNFTFLNVCRDPESGQALNLDFVQSLESIYNTLGTLFKHEGTL